MIFFCYQCLLFLTFGSIPPPVPFVFGFPAELSNPAERQLSSAMGCYWTNFAATGDPNKGKCSTALNLPQWPVLGVRGGDAIVFNSSTTTPATVVSNLKSQQCDAFAKFY